MSPSTRLGQNLWRTVAIAAVLALVIAGALWWVFKGTGSRTVTAYFPTTIGLYEENTVRVRGVDIGTIDKIEPEGERVKVVMSVDRTVEIPADAQALIVAPSLVSDRYVQFTPAYSGGPTLEDNAVIPQDRTAVPLETDELYETLIEVTETLGPRGANKEGALSRLLKTVAANFKGNGRALNVTINKLGKASGTLEGNADDLFATVSNLAKLSKTVAASDTDLGEFQRRLADVSGFLASERQNLSSTVKLLGATLGKVRKFIEDNKDRLRSNVNKLADVTTSLVEVRGSLAEIFDVAPVALANVIQSYNGATGALDARANINELGYPPILMICKFADQVEDLPQNFIDLCTELAPLGDALPSGQDVIEALHQGQIPAPIADLIQVIGGGQ